MAIIEIPANRLRRQTAAVSKPETQGRHCNVCCIVGPLKGGVGVFHWKQVNEFRSDCDLVLSIKIAK